MYPPQEGKIELLGCPRGKKARRKNNWQALVLQNPAHQLHLPSVGQEEAWAAARLAVARKITALGLSGLEDRHLHSLSSGQERRVTLAADLAREPQLLLLDEPSVGQDDASLTLLQRLAVYVHDGGTLITATPDRRVATFLGQHCLLLARPGALQGGPGLVSTFFKA